MGNDFIISIKGTQLIDGHAEKTELITSCKLKRENDSFVIKYSEFDENNKKVSDSTLIVKDSGLVTVLRKNVSTSELTLEKGKRHICNYVTDYGLITLGTFTKNITCNLTKNGGTLELHYSLDVNSNFLSENKIIINLKKGVKN